MLLLDQLAQQGNHDDGGGQVVQCGGEEECDKADHPQQVDPLAGADAVGDDLEAFVGIDQLDDGHGTHQEEQNLGNFAQMMAQLFGDVMVIATGAGGGGTDQRQNAVRAEYQQGPAD